MKPRLLIALATLSLADCTCSTESTILASQEQPIEAEIVRTVSSGWTLACAGGHGFGFCLPTGEEKSSVSLVTDDGQWDLGYDCEVGKGELASNDAGTIWAYRCGDEKWTLGYAIGERQKLYEWPQALDGSRPGDADFPTLIVAAPTLYASTESRWLDEMIAAVREAGGDDAVAKLLIEVAGQRSTDIRFWTATRAELPIEQRSTVDAALRSAFSSADASRAHVEKAIEVLPIEEPAFADDVLMQAGRFAAERAVLAETLLWAAIGHDPQKASEIACVRLSNNYCGPDCMVALAGGDHPCPELTEQLDHFRCSARLRQDEKDPASPLASAEALSQLVKERSSARNPSIDPRLWLAAATRRNAVPDAFRRANQRRQYEMPSNCNDEACVCNTQLLREMACKLDPSQTELTTPLCTVQLDDESGRFTDAQVESTAMSELRIGTDLACARLADEPSTVRCWGQRFSHGFWREYSDVSGFTVSSFGYCLVRETAVECYAGGASVPWLFPDVTASEVVDVARAGRTACVLDGSKAVCREPATNGVERPTDGLPDAKRVFVADRDTVCVIGTDGDLWCRGPNEKSRFDDDPDAGHVDGKLVFEGPIADVALSQNAVCIARESGEVRCRGRYTDTKSEEAEQLALSEGSLCFLHDGAVSCLGDGVPNGPADKPVAVELPARVTSITASGNNTCALLEDGTARCWGSTHWVSGSAQQAPHPIDWKAVASRAVKD